MTIEEYRALFDKFIEENGLDEREDYWPEDKRDEFRALYRVSS